MQGRFLKSSQTLKMVYHKMLLNPRSEEFIPDSSKQYFIDLSGNS